MTEKSDHQTPANNSGVFSIVQFRWLFLGNAAFFFAMQGQMLTRTLLAWDLTGEATSLAYVNLVVAVPMIFASMIGGAVTDRVERRRLVLLGQGLITCNEIVILMLLITGNLQFWHMLCTAFLAGCAFPFIMPARMAITVSVVGRERLQSAMAYSAGALNMSRVVGPAIMGVIIAQFSYTAAYVFSVCLYLCAILFMLQLGQSRSQENPIDKKPLLADIIHGFSYVKHNRPVMLCLLFGLVPMFLAMPFQNLLVVLAEEAWQVGEGGVGILMATGGIGGVFGAIWIVKRGDHSGRLKLMLGSTLAFGVFLAIFSQTKSFTLSLAPLLIANICVSASQTVNNAAVQLLVDDNVRGRMSSFMMLSYGLTPIGVFPMALAADSFGAANAILAASLLLILTVVIFWFGSSTIRNLDGFIRESQTRHAQKSTAPGA